MALARRALCLVVCYEYQYFESCDRTWLGVGIDDAEETRWTGLF